MPDEQQHDDLDVRLGPFSEHEVRMLADSAFYALLYAHEVIVDAVEGRAINFNRLENYMSAMHEILERSDQVEMLLDGALQDLSDADWYGTVKEKPQPARSSMRLDPPGKQPDSTGRTVGGKTSIRSSPKKRSKGNEPKI